MHAEIEELRPKLKEILYDCAVEIRATKAALYLLDGTTKKYELVTEFGFRSAIRQSAGSNDPMVDRCARGRSPFYVNTPGVEPRLSQLLFDSATERLMGVPLFSRGQLVGFIDMRDKAQKQPFDQVDVGKAQNIADRILALFASKNIWNQRFITLADTALPANVATPPPPVQAPTAVPHREIVHDAKSTVERLMKPDSGDQIGPAEMAAVLQSLRAILLLPNVIAVAFSATGSTENMQEVASRGTMTQDALAALHLKLQSYLTKRGELAGVLKTTLHNPLGLTMQPITAAQLQKVFTAAVIAGNFRGLYLTVAFSEAPPQSTHEMLAVLLDQLQSSIEAASTRAALQSLRLRVAEKLLEPDYASYPELRRHTDNVIELVESFSRHLGLAPADAETVKLTAMVHDCGLRVLDYEKLYRKKNLSHDELALLREHVTVGAAMVEPLLGPGVARAVLCHHERVDGAGYPNELKGDQIPLPARILQICDVYDAIVSPSSYQTPEPPEDALAAIRRGAGGQFDEQLSKAFVEMMHPRVQSTTLAGR